MNLTNGSRGLVERIAQVGRRVVPGALDFLTFDPSSPTPVLVCSSGERCVSAGPDVFDNLHRNTPDSWVGDGRSMDDAGAGGVIKLG
jgi:hypothetical protein